MDGSNGMDGIDTDLVHRLRAVVEGDDRLRALLLTGSVGRGEADGWSDVDTAVVVAPEHLDDVFTRWEQIAAPLGPVVLTKRIAPARVVNQVLAGWHRLDVALVAADRARFVRDEVEVVVAKDPLTFRDAPPRVVDLVAVEDLTVEFLRCLALLPVVVGREEYVTGVSGAGLLRTHLVALMRLVDDPGRATGMLHLRRCLTPEHYALLESLPAPSPSRDDVVAAHRALRDAFLPLARRTLGERYPRRVADAALATVAPLLG